MNEEESTAHRSRVIAELRELIDAIDRRMRHVERVGEIQIAREAAALRSAAMARIEELEDASSPPRSSR